MRYLRDNKSTASPSNLAFFDCETLPEGGGGPTDYGLHKLHFGCASAIRLVDGKPTRPSKLTFDTSEQFWEWLKTRCRAKSCLWVFAHNLGFDATIVKLWERIESGDLEIVMPKKPNWWDKRHPDKEWKPNPLCILDDPPTVLALKDKDGNQYKFCDTLNYWRTSLSTLGKGIGTPKLDMPAFGSGRNEWEAYCSRDVEIIERGVIGLIHWIKSEDLGKFRLTTPSQAMAAYRHRFKDHKILYHDDKAARRIERASYYGGQVECYLHGRIDQQVHQLDITSLYPSVMAGNYYPWRLRDVVEYDRPPKRIPFTDGFDTIAEVTIDTNERTYPKREANGIYHVSGAYRTTLCGPELDFALNAGHVAKVHKYAKYDIAKLFDSYVAYFWNKRAEYKAAGNTLGDLLCKLLLNSLYGKFGQTGTDWEVQPTNPFDFRWGSGTITNAKTGMIEDYHVMGDVCRKRIKCDEIPTAFPAIAAYVTAYGRQRMYDIRQLCGETHVFYQAVDCVYVDDLGLSRLRDSGQVGEKQLGKLELVGSYPYGEFLGINNYKVGRKKVRGAIKASAVEVAHRVWEEPHFQHIASILAEPLQGGVEITRMLKHPTDKYTRRTIQPNQLTSPLYLTDDPTID